MNPDELRKRHAAALPEWIALYYERPMELVRGEGFRVWDSEGNEYLDFFGGIVTTISGHAVPEIAEAVQEQAAKIFHSSTLYLIENQVKLAEKLISLSPISGDQKVFFVGSGSEANEAALLFATQYRNSSEIVALRGSYHGGSFGTMGTTGQSSWRPTPRSALDVSYAMTPHRSYSPLYGPFEGDPEGFARACAEDVRRVIETTTTGRVAAFIAEPIQGVGGFIEIPPGYFERVKEILDEYDVLLISDEVQTAFGRTGSHFWGIEASGVEPDLITMAKGLTSAYVQLGALGMRRKYAEHFNDNVFYGGLTYNSHPLACATALATIDVYEEENLIERAAEMGEVMKRHHDELAAKHPSIGAVRSIGMFGIVELVRNRETMEPMAPFNGTSDEMAALGKRFREEGLYTFVRWNTFFTNPPLTISEEEMAEGFEIIDRALEITDAAVV